MRQNIWHFLPQSKGCLNSRTCPKSKGLRNKTESLELLSVPNSENYLKMYPNFKCPISSGSVKFRIGNWCTVPTLTDPDIQKLF